jgi:hypothetical protein
VVDCTARFLQPMHEPAEQLGEHEAKGARSSYIDAALMYDMLHLTPAGYAVWAECLRPVVNATLGPSRDAAG